MYHNITAVYKFLLLSVLFAPQLYGLGIDNINNITLNHNNHFKTSGGSIGVDVSTLLSVDDYRCLIEKGYGEYVIPRGFRSVGDIDEYICENLENAQQAGISTRDVYLFPKPTSQTLSASEQIKMLKTHLSTNCRKDSFTGTIWLDSKFIY